MASITSVNISEVKKKSYRKMALIFGYLGLGIAILFHFISYKTPYFHEDEAIYYNFSLNAGPDFQNGIVWKWVGHIVDYWANVSVIKIVPLVFGVVLILVVALWEKRSLFAVAVGMVFAMSPVVFSQAHRFRPEVVHSTLSLLAFCSYALAVQAHSLNKRSANVFFAGGLLFTLLVVHTHIMSALHYPGLVLAAIYASFKIMRRPFLVLTSYAILFVAFFLFFQPQLLHQGLGYLKTISGSQIPLNSITLLDPIRIILLNSRVWFIDVLDGRAFFSAGNHLAVLMQILIASFGFTLAAVIWSCRKKLKSIDPFVVFSALNVIVFILSIYYFKRINNSYLLIFVQWLFFTLVTCARYIDRNLKALIILFMLLPSGILELAHYQRLIYPFNESRFEENLNSIKKMASDFGCGEYPFVSAPYFPFFKSTDAADLSKLNNFAADIQSKLNALAPSSCVVIHARHLWGFEFFSQYSMANLRNALSSNFDVIDARLSMYETHKPRELKIKVRDEQSFPVGSDYIYYDGEEVVYVYKRKNTPWKN